MEKGRRLFRPFAKPSPATCRLGDYGGAQNLTLCRLFEGRIQIIEPDDEPRAPRAGEGDTIKSQKSQALDDDGIAAANRRGLGDGDHGGDTAVERRRFLVRKIVGQA